MESTEQKSQYKILIIDDDPEIRTAMAIRLKSNNYAVGFAFDGTGAIAHARNQYPDIILLDLGLPGADGFTVLESLRANLNLAGIPIIVISGHPRATHGPRALKAGAQLFYRSLFETPIFSSPSRQS